MKPGRRRAGDDRAALAGDEDARAERLAAGVLEHDVDVAPPVSSRIVLPSRMPLLRVLGPSRPSRTGSPLGLRSMISSAPIVAADLAFSGAGDDAHRRRRRRRAPSASRSDAQPAGRAPDQHDVAVLHPGAVAARPAAGRRWSSPARGRRPPPRSGAPAWASAGSPSTSASSRQPAEVGLEAPDPLLGVEHRVVVARPGPPARPRGSAPRTSSPGFQACTPGPVRSTTPRQVRAHHVVRLVVPLAASGEQRP